MSTNNQTGKVKVECSCGVKAALDDYDIPRWEAAHNAAMPGVKHSLTFDVNERIGVGEVW